MTAFAKVIDPVCAAGSVSGTRAVGDGVAAGVGVTTFTPLSQTNFLPDLIHVYLNPLLVAVVPALVHVAPALGAAALATPVSKLRRRTGVKTIVRVLFMR